MKKRFWLIPLFLVGGALILFYRFIICETPRVIEDLELKKETLTQEVVGENGVLSNSGRQIVLDGIERYIIDNRIHLRVFRYYRSEDAISVIFYSGTHYLCMPEASGIK